MDELGEIMPVVRSSWREIRATYTLSSGILASMGMKDA